MFLFEGGRREREGGGVVEGKEILECEVNNDIIWELYVNFMEI